MRRSTVTQALSSRLVGIGTVNVFDIGSGKVQSAVIALGIAAALVLLSLIVVRVHP
jgi:hypothetical protein